MTNISVPAANLLKISTALLENADYDKMYEIAHAVARNPALLKDFADNPEAAAYRINGFKVPPGFHMHVGDGLNVYYPAEGDALSQVGNQEENTAWSRIEVRAGYGPMSCIICLWCS